MYTYKRNLAGESDAPLFVTYIDNISENSVRLKYTWLISDNVTIFNSADGFGIMEVRSANSNGFSLSNEDSIILSRGSMVNLLDGLCLVVNDNSSLEYYPMMSGESPPHPLRVHNLNTGENFSTIQLTLRGIRMPVVDARGSGSAITLAADGITLEGFTATGSGYYPETGIKVTSNSNKLSSNNASSNTGAGIILSSSGNNKLSGNIANSNNMYGIYLVSSSNNTIYNNYFNNTNNVFDDGNNIWNITKTAGTNIINGAFFGGNFWANPGGTGFSQTCEDADKDGICDAQYNLYSNNTDYLPLTLVTEGEKGDLNGNGVSADAGDLVLMKRASIGEITLS